VTAVTISVHFQFGFPCTAVPLADIKHHSFPANRDIEKQTIGPVPKSINHTRGFSGSHFGQINKL
jgi:hypothetical protein